MKAFRDKRVIAVLLGLVVAVLAVYSQVLSHDFINFDDDVYVTQNPHVLQGLTAKSITWAFTSGYAGNWHPLTWLSHMFDCELFGMQAWGHHLTNLLLHIANSVLLFLVFKRMTGVIWQSALVAALFALHPLHVESVAWVAERKDVLSGLFWILTMWAYVRYTERATPLRYSLTLLLFAFGLMAKPMLVTLPFVLLLLDVWPLGRLGMGTISHEKAKRSAGNKTSPAKPSRLIREKIPLFVMAIASSVITFVVQQRGGAVTTLESVPLAIRFANALVAYVEYIIKTVWPSGLMVFNPHPGGSLSIMTTLGAGAALLGITLFTIKRIRTHPFLCAGWLWYVVTLIPVIGLIQVGEQAMADRYTYIPSIGLFLIVSWGAYEYLKGRGIPKITLPLTSGIAILILSITAFSQVRYWKNDIRLFQHSLSIDPTNWVAHLNLGIALDAQGKPLDAIPHYEESLKYRPGYYKTLNNLGVAEGKTGKLDEGAQNLLKALKANPNYAEAFNNLGIIYAMQGRTSEAEKQFLMALQVEPESQNAHFNLGVALTERGRFDEAIIHYQASLRINPTNQRAREELKRVTQLKEQSR